MKKFVIGAIALSLTVATSVGANAQGRMVYRGNGGIHFGGGFRAGGFVAPRFGGYGGWGGGVVVPGPTVIIPGTTYIYCQPWQGDLTTDAYGNPICVLQY